MIIFIVGIGGLAVGFIGGYIVAQYWGKPARDWKKLEKEGLHIYKKAKERLEEI